jgi:F420H2 dehydrogenase subunit F
MADEKLPIERFRVPPGQNYCLHCGLCLPVCRRLQEKGDRSLCKECLLCYSTCPRLHPPEIEASADGLVGSYRKIWQVKSVERPKGAQDAGIVTLLIRHLLEDSEVDAALLIGRDREWHPEPVLVARREEADKAAGTKFTVATGLSGLKEGVSRFKRLALVGLPCQLAALHNLYRKGKGYPQGGKVVFTIGLFCMTSFIYGAPFPKGLKDVIEQELGTSIDRVDKIEITKGKLRVFLSGATEPVVRGLKVLGDVTWPTCLGCGDYTALFADLSVGSVGSEENTNTVIVRTDAGSRVFDRLLKKGWIRAEELGDLTELKRVAELKKNRRDKLSPGERDFLGKGTVLGNWLNRLEQSDS